MAYNSKSPKIKNKSKSTYKKRNIKSPIKKTRKTSVKKSVKKSPTKNLKVYTGYKEKYVKGLKGKQLEERKKELARNQKLAKKGIKTYDKKYWKTDKYGKSKKSSYTQQFHKKYGKDVKSLAQIAKATGWPLKCLKEIEKRGYGAYYSSGNRSGNVSPQQWSRSRIYSVILNKKAAKTADRDIVLRCKPKRKSSKK